MNENQNVPVIEMRGVNAAARLDASFMVAEDVNWSVAAGEFWVIAGLEHSGTTDLLMLAAGLVPPAAGTCRLLGNNSEEFGEAEPAERLRIGFIFDGGHLFNQLTIAENVALPLRYQKNLTAVEAAREVQSLLAGMGLAPLADVTPANVAANWRQRAALARALILKPEVLLLDNPLAGLGARHRQWWLRFLERLARGHEHFGSKPVTLIASAEDLRPWQPARSKFAVLHDKTFTPLGVWSDVEGAGHPVVKELLAVPDEATL